ncbi:protein tiptop [Neodiprion virginianus]|uniref:protein tiptop n=1 Tax=Neodiprion virginianus TaxID=2961670 RepID=UPI001EE7130A|nr:protein tiptop [Neodiprion virginianus]XP_046604534.1 protein tiptop [Neodiprion virginianus]XP_046604535.1 protein tiptop [Neodiprion virginianus]XP_046604536.1 protein tiptop [Neodiprion virginianus]XP_046604537.1 protein tiptop [Neodiprion virginianus]
MRSKQQPRPSFRWPQQRGGDNLTGGDGVEGSGPGTDLQGEEGDCADEDGPVSPSDRGCGVPANKEDEEGSPSEEDDEDEPPTSTPPPAASPLTSTRLNPAGLRDTGPPDRDPMSPRCPSRESRESSGPTAGSPPLPPRSSASPVSPTGIVPLPLGAHPLLPPHSAAVMAAYIQQTHQRLLLGHSPLSRGSVSPLVSSSCSPPAATPGLLVSPNSGGDLSPGATTLPAVLDFSTRKASSTEEEEDDTALNLSKPPTPSSSSETNNGPLDLSVPSRKRPGPEDSPPPPPRKSSRLASTTSHQESYGRPVVSPWTSPVVASHFPYFAAAVAAATSQQQLSPKASGGVDHQLWNGKMKPPAALEKPYQPSDATKALEKMSELSKIGGDDLYRPGSGNSGSGNAVTGSSSRHSAWQSHWLNKGAEQAKDVLKCVWCKQSFPTLAAMSTHMKEAKHCGVNMPVPPPPSALHQQQQPPQMPSIQAPQHQPQTSTSASSGGTPSSKQSPSELNLLIKETMPLPRKLVRGQDVWLGKGAEQTRQILKCMWCGQSFRSLAEMTSHMQQTQHYTNIISQEQIISWKSSDENKGSGTGGGGGGGAGGGPPTGGSSGHPGGGGPGSGATSSHVSAVLTCKVCDQAFSSLKELSNHMVKNSHYKEHIMRSITESGGRRRQTREKRKKSLPVRKLLELERAQNEFKNGDASGGLGHTLGKHAGRITCEKCGDKIETTIFVDHIRQCIGAGVVGMSQRNFLKNALMSNHAPPPSGPPESGRKSVSEDASSVSSRHHRSPSSASDATTPGKETPTPTPTETPNSSPSVLNAIEKLIEKSFDSRARHGASGLHHSQAGAPMGSSILKRLGIDESVDYMKPLVDPQSMNLLRSYQQQHYNAAVAARRERSGSESSSISERGSGRTDVMTPERRSMDLSGGHERLSHPQHHHRVTPDKQPALPARLPHPEESGDEEQQPVIKKEPREEEGDATPEENLEQRRDRDVVVKKEVLEDREEEDHQPAYNHQQRGSHHDATTTATSAEDDRAAMSPPVNPPTPRPSSGVEQVARSPCRNSTSSPTSSDRSVTPRGTPDTKTSSSLGALSSMFDSLSGGGGGGPGGGGSDAQGRKTSSHPLAALQKLCDKTETRGSSSGGSRSGAGTSSSHGQTGSGGGGGGGGGSSGGGGGGNSGGGSGLGQAPGSTPGAILAFSWACNDAVVTADSIMKCAFCDTPFISKGAYRHHLSKMHFVKDGVIPDPMTVGRSPSQAQSSSGGPGHSAPSPPSQRNKSPPIAQPNGSPSQPAPSPLEESPHSKFLKYTELAKQLSSKYV